MAAATAVSVATQMKTYRAVIHPELSGDLGTVEAQRRQGPDRCVAGLNELRKPPPAHDLLVGHAVTMGRLPDDVLR
jgi:hypothetical protein